ncbi:hypothetical protein YC2023_051019 [Brassica napus]
MGECAMLGRGRTDLYGPVQTGMTRVCPTRPLVMFWDCAKSGPSCAKLGRDQNVSWRLCAYLGLISMIWSCGIKRASREDALWITWKQATNGSSLDRLAVAVKERPALTMYLDRYKGRFRGALEAPIRAKPPHPIRRQLSLHQSRCITQIGTDSTPHLSHPSFKSH